MKRHIRNLTLCMLIVLLTTTGVLIADRNKLKNSLIRFHVVANSDSQRDQDIKINVRDAVIKSIQYDLNQVADVNQAKAYLEENLPKIEAIANSVLEKAGFEDKAKVSLCKEAFSLRKYDTFTLPSGVYEALRIVIGSGEGKNWWCVSYPSLCAPATSHDFLETAAQSGIPPRIANSLVNDVEYDLHFYLLDYIGSIENIFFKD